MKLFTTFHLNLSFSSIEEEDHDQIIKRCYWPLLSLCEIENIRIGIEISGKTIERIQELDKGWIKKLSALIQTKQVELIGSGYVQIIGPLVPYEVNYWNHRLGLKTYKEYFSQVPTIALINEMVYSSGMVDLLEEFGYKGFIMDENNIKLSHKSTSSYFEKSPNYAIGLKKNSIPIIWSNSFIFQKLQHYVHGDISLETYLDFFDHFKPSQENIIPFYTNDAECFDFRPGRFNTESLIHKEGEWNRVKNLMVFLSKNRDITWSTPSDVLTQLKKEEKIEANLVSSANPVPVKKQPKYNITRWAISGRNDIWLNTTCFSLYEVIKNTKRLNNELSWKTLCNFWSSDLRTHITQKRWVKVKKEIHDFADELNLNIGEQVFDYEEVNTENIDISQNYHSKECSFLVDREKTILSITTQYIDIDLNLRKGLTIKNLKYKNSCSPILGTIPHGYFDSIKLGADFFSGGIQAQGFFEGQKISDLQSVMPEILLSKESIFIKTIHPTSLGEVFKTLIISLINSKVRIRYEFPSWKRGSYFLRVGYLTLLPKFWGNDIEVSYVSGAKNLEVLLLDDDFDHSEPVSSLVSNSTGIPVTGGYINIFNKEASINISWKPEQCAVLPMLINKKDRNGYLTRLLFSLQEIDDTLKPGGDIPSFEFTISND